MKRVLLLLTVLGTHLVAQTSPAPEKPADEAVHPISPATATARAKQIIEALEDFDATYNGYPSAETAKQVKEATGTKIPLKDTSSNQLFRQLIVNGLKSEKIFCLRPENEPQPDDKFDDDAHILAPGECSFSYVTGRTSYSNPWMPILMAPMIKGTTTFDPKPFKGKALIVNREGKVEIRPIGADGKVLDKDGKDIFDPSQFYWENQKPEIRYPE